MGETVLPTVEESSPQLDEPPICGLNEPHNSPNKRHPQPIPADGGGPPTLHAPHTLSFEEVAEKLRVDIKYDLPVFLLIGNRLTSIAMDSLTLKRSPASSSMALTRLREL